MQLKPNSKAALNTWISPRTWDSDHAYDRQRFYKFVDQYQEDHGCSMNESEMRTMIKQLAEEKGHTYGKHQEELVFDYVKRARDILEYIEMTR